MLSCDCSEDGDWWHFPPEDYQRLDTIRWRRCFSCKALIRPGDLCAKFVCERDAWGDIEERIYGDTKPLPNKWLCERCADLYFSLSELGFCVSIPADMRALVKEYADMQADAARARASAKVSAEREHS